MMKGNSAMAKRKTRKRKRLPNRQQPTKTAVSLPKELRELFEDIATEQGYTLSYTVVLFIRENLERKR